MGNQSHIVRALVQRAYEGTLHSLITFVGDVDEGLAIAEWLTVISTQPVRTIARPEASLSEWDWPTVFDTPNGVTVLCVEDPDAVPLEVMGRSQRFELRPVEMTQ